MQFHFKGINLFLAGNILMRKVSENLALVVFFENHMYSKTKKNVLTAGLV